MKLLQQFSTVCRWSTYFSAIALLLSLNSCTKLELNEIITEESNQPVEVTVSLIGIDFTLDPATRATVYESGITRIALKVFNKDGDEVANASQIKSEAGDDFNKLTIQLPADTYTFVVVAHDTSADDIGCATITSPEVVTLPEGIIPTLYAHVEEDITIENANNQTITFDMGKRINATLRLTSTDIVPDDVARMTVDINHDGITLSATVLPQINPSTGYSLGNYRFARALPVTAGEPIDVCMNLLLQDDEYSFPMIINAQNTSNKNINDYTRSFASVPFQRAYVTNACGQYFRYVNSISLTFDTTSGTLDYSF